MLKTPKRKTAIEEYEQHVQDEENSRRTMMRKSIIRQKKEGRKPSFKGSTSEFVKRFK